jgi:ABC-2 type transport system ATP-binding protein
LLLLDEPTVGVDPLSRRELWEIILQLVSTQELTVFISTSYLDEAARCSHVIVLHRGRALAQGHPDEISRLAAGRTFLAEPTGGEKPRELQARLLDDASLIDAVPEGGRVRFVVSKETEDEGGSRFSEGYAGSSPRPTPTPARFEDGFMTLLKSKAAEAEERTGKRKDFDVEQTARPDFSSSPGGDKSLPPQQGEAAIQVRDLVRRFGAFTAVDHVSFDVRRGEIFGLLGPNGAGKTTTFRMLCGLLAATAGTLQVAGVDLRRARASARQRIGYVAQKFSLYGQLSVTENLEFFASAYNLRGARKQDRLHWALQQFDLVSLAGLPSGNLPGGFKQRLAMAAALLHEPEILFLDEPTSGADPLARREFWRRITDLAEHSVTVVVTTHFMEEAEYCDRVAIMDAGRILAQGTPAEIRNRALSEAAREPTMEDAFIAVVDQARGGKSNSRTAPRGAP